MIRRCPNKLMRAQLHRLRDDYALIDDVDRDVREAILRAKRSGNSAMLRHEPLDVVAPAPPPWLADDGERPVRRQRDRLSYSNDSKTLSSHP